MPAIERELKDAHSRRLKRGAEQALRSSEERFHRLVQAMPLALLIADSSGHIIYANEGVERLLGYTQSEIETGALTLNRIFGASNSHESLLKRWARGNGDPLEIECRTSAGTIVPVLVGAARLNREAPPEERQFVAFLADLTEQKRSDEIYQRTEKLAAAGRLAASIAHEINNPLEAVTNCMYLMSQSVMSDEARQYLQLAQRELNRVVHITTQTAALLSPEHAAGGNQCAGPARNGRLPSTTRGCTPIPSALSAASAPCLPLPSSTARCARCSQPRRRSD